MNEYGQGIDRRAFAAALVLPPIAIIISWLLLGEVPPALAIVGGAACTIGVIVVRTSSRRGRQSTVVVAEGDAL